MLHVPHAAAVTAATALLMLPRRITAALLFCCCRQSSFPLGLGQQAICFVAESQKCSDNLFIFDFSLLYFQFAAAGLAVVTASSLSPPVTVFGLYRAGGSASLALVHFSSSLITHNFTVPARQRLRHILVSTNTITPYSPCQRT